MTDGDVLDFIANLHPAWHAQAACRGATNLFFDGSKAAKREARKVCAGCPVLRQCSEHREYFGVWGGK